jgi:ubiquinone/menaquinone biosynthesis C-methylase UbiE
MLKNALYTLLITDVTERCYQNCLEYVRPHSALLDVGIGNGGVIRTQHRVIREKDLRIVGIDIDADYLARCQRLIREHGLEDQVRTVHAPIEEYCPDPGVRFRYVIFTMSFMLLPDQQLALERLRPWLLPEGEVIFVQTMFQRRSRLVDYWKPKLRYLTTVDFGKALYEDEFFPLLQEARLTVTEDRILKRECFGGQYRMVVARPNAAVPAAVGV